MALTQLDRELLQRCLANDSGAWNDFVDRYIGLFFHIINHTAHARSVRLSEDDIDDLCAEVFVQLLKNDFAPLRRFQGESSLATYLTVIVRRIVVHEIARRRKAEEMGHVSAYGASFARAQSEASNNNEIPRIDNKDEIEQMMSGLEKTEALAIRKFHLEGCSYQEISEQLKIPKNSIGPLLSRTRDLLRKQNITR